MIHLAGAYSGLLDCERKSVEGTMETIQLVGNCKEPQLLPPEMRTEPDLKSSCIHNDQKLMNKVDENSGNVGDGDGSIKIQRQEQGHLNDDNCRTDKRTGGGDSCTVARDKFEYVKSGNNLREGDKIEDKCKEYDDSNENNDQVTEDHDKDQNYDDIADIINLIDGLTSEDPEVHKEALEIAQQLIEDEETIMGDGAGDQKASPDVRNEQTEDVTEEAFVEDLSPEQILERKGTRKERKIKSDICRQNGNICCHKNEYEEAIRWYTEAIELIRDSACLYTNRALAYIKGGQYASAIEDCEKGIYLANSSLKARLYKAKALYMNGSQLECLACLEDTRQVLPAHRKAIDHCQVMIFGEQCDVKLPRKECDVFPGESFMRLAADCNVTKMSTFFEDSPTSKT